VPTSLLNSHEDGRAAASAFEILRAGEGLLALASPNLFPAGILFAIVLGLGNVLGTYLMIISADSPCA
jgi:hypothetical protein